MTPLPIHEPTGRPSVRGLPVPYVTRWTGEHCHDYLQVVGVAGRPQIAYEDDPIGTHRISGILWNRDKIAPGTGEPEWRAVHTGRHRVCMTAPRCQVCGKRFRAGEPVTFLHQVVPDWRAHSEPFTTTTPPTCRSCAPWAKQLCPVLRANLCVLVEATEYTPVSVCGDLYDLDGTCQKVELRLDDPLMSMMVAKQVVVEVTRYTTSDVPQLPGRSNSSITHLRDEGRLS